MIVAALLLALLSEASARMKMGVHVNCDDGHTQIEKDFNCHDFICSGPLIEGAVGTNIRVKKHSKTKDYGNDHACMDKTLSYNVTVPSSGTHRPVWPRYGEYPYVPPQRWIHGLEHGAIAVLYNPCLDPSQVSLLRKETDRMARNGQRLYIMTPFNLPRDMPIALVGWRSDIQMNGVDTAAIRKFIKERYNQGLEKVSGDGHYDFLHEQTQVPVQFEELCQTEALLKQVLK